jgi:hypothetical protein
MHFGLVNHMREDFLESIDEDFGHQFIDYIAKANWSKVCDLSRIFLYLG